MAGAPAHLWVPAHARGSYGSEVADLAKLMCRPLTDPQRVAVDAMTAYGPGGGWAALETLVKGPRQGTGKTSAVLTPITLADLFLWDADKIAWTAHLFKTTRDAFEDHCYLIESTPDLDRRVDRISYSHGEESISLRAQRGGVRAVIEYLARSKGGGRGLSGKRVVIDEALYFAAEAAGAILPILATRANAQISYASSAAKVESKLLRRLTKRGRAGGDPSLVLVEFCAPGSWEEPGCARGVDCPHTVGVAGCALDDRDLWLAANVGVPELVAESFLEDMRRTLDPLEFGREFLGWDEPGEEDEDRPITLDAWDQCSRDAHLPAGAAPAMFADVSPGMRSGTIGAAWLDGVPRVDLADHRPGTDWFVARCAVLAETYPEATWACEAAGAVGALLPKLAAAGIVPEAYTGPDMGRACGHLQGLVKDRAFTHSGDPLLSTALAGAVKRDVGEGLWAWGRRKSVTDISPLVAATGALWLLENRPADTFFASTR